MLKFSSLLTKEATWNVSNRTKRNSNMELFRIVLIFLVLVVHADFFTLGIPTQADVFSNPMQSFMRFFIQSVSIVAVNGFVLLSGWFGIRAKVSSFLNLVFQILFYGVGIYVICLSLGLSEFNINGVLNVFLMTNAEWFVKSYIGLLILSPILNTFIENTTEKQLRLAVIYFYIFQTLYGWFPGGAQFFERGYSTMSFVGLYLLARYIRLYMYDVVSWNKWFDLLGYFGIVFFITVVAFVAQRLGISLIMGRMYDYSSPFVVLAPIFLLLFFSKLSIKSKFVNWVGASSFAAYLLHVNPNLCRPFYCRCIYFIYENNAGVCVLLLIFLFLLMVFFMALLIDQLRIFVWNKIIYLTAKNRQ